MYIKDSKLSASKRTTAAEVEIELKRHHQTREKPGTRLSLPHVKPSYSCPYTPYLLSSFGTSPSVRLIEGVRLIEVVKIAQCLLTINIQRLLCTVIKLHAVQAAIQSSSSLPLNTYFTVKPSQAYTQDSISELIIRLDYQPLFGKMSQHSSPERAAGRVRFPLLV